MAYEARQEKHPDSIQGNLRWNFAVLSLDYGLFGLGLTLASVSTVLPAYAERLGAPNLLIGAFPAILTAGRALPAALAANVVERKDRALPFVLAGTFFERVPYLLMGLVALGFALTNPGLALALTLLLMAMVAVTGGVLMPAWMEVVAKVIPVAVRGRFFASGNIVSGLTGLGGAALVGYFLHTFPFPTSYALCFFAAFAALMVSFAFLAATREHRAPSTRPRVDTLTYLRRLPGVVRRDRNFSSYLLARAFGVSSTIGNAFYTVFALKQLQTPETQVAVFTGLLLAAHAGGTAVWGWLADRHGHKTVLVIGAACSLLGNLIALFAVSPAMMYPVFVLMGASIGATAVSHTTIALEFAGPKDRPTYVGLVGTVLAPFALVPPLLGGALADYAGYSPVFALSAALAATSLVWLATAVREPRAASSP